MRAVSLKIFVLPPRGVQGRSFSVLGSQSYDQDNSTSQARFDCFLGTVQVKSPVKIVMRNKIYSLDNAVQIAKKQNLPNFLSVSLFVPALHSRIIYIFCCFYLQAIFLGYKCMSERFISQIKDLDTVMANRLNFVHFIMHVHVVKVKFFML